jgi:hypothetical protein
MAWNKPYRNPFTPFPSYGKMRVEYRLTTDMEMTPELLANRKSIQCPSCDLKVSDSIFAELELLATSLDRIEKEQAPILLKIVSHSETAKLLKVEYIGE